MLDRALNRCKIVFNASEMAKKTTQIPQNFINRVQID